MFSKQTMLRKHYLCTLLSIFLCFYFVFGKEYFSFFWNLNQKMNCLVGIILYYRTENAIKTITLSISIEVYMNRGIQYITEVIKTKCGNWPINWTVLVIMIESRFSSFLDRNLELFLVKKKKKRFNNDSYIFMHLYSFSHSLSLYVYIFPTSHSVIIDMKSFNSECVFACVVGQARIECHL